MRILAGVAVDKMRRFLMPVPATKTGSMRFEFDKDQLIVGKDTDIRNQLSAVAADGKHLFLACEEGCLLERLSLTSDTAFSDHQVFALDTLLTLPAPAKEEADIEGIYVDGDVLWIVGSHSVKRKKPKGDSPSEIAAKIRETTRDGSDAGVAARRGALLRQRSA